MRTSGSGSEAGIDAPAEHEPPLPLTGSIRSDRAAFLLLLLVLGLVVAPRLPVYHSLQPMRVRVVAVTAAGERIALDVPEALSEPRKNLRETERRVREFAASAEARRLTPPAGRLEWYVEYSRNFARSHLVVTEPARP